MIVATWNLAGKSTPAHERLLQELGADILLLTEVMASTLVDVRSSGTMSLGQSYAAVRGVDASAPAWLPPFAAAGRRSGVTYLSSVLPWRSMGGDQAENTRTWLGDLDWHWPDGEVVWGGDWNHELHGRMWVGCRPGREAILELLARRGLVCPTALLQTRKGARTIDHVAVPGTWRIDRVELVEVPDRLSDHDIVIVDCDPGPESAHVSP